MGISVTSLAKRIGVSKQYVSRAEHGTYSALNNDLVRFASEKLRIKPAEFVRRYKEFQHATREHTLGEMNPQILARRGSLAPGNEIFSTWRSGYWRSVVSFCNAFCVHPEIVMKYEEGVRSDMPAPLREILNEVGLIDPNWIDDPKRIMRNVNHTNVETVIEAHENLKGAAKFSTNFPIQRNRSERF